ncbi:hypothetical protein MC885_007447 [Smutsia gigantea]|nr:hypothetical protein MC885_007447 [Smutsia gigantea]
MDDIVQQQITNTVEESLDLTRISLDERIHVKMRNDREPQGRLHAYDQHLNMILGDVEDIVTTIEIDEETYEDTIYKSTKWNILMLFVWGDGSSNLVAISVCLNSMSETLAYYDHQLLNHILNISLMYQKSKGQTLVPSSLPPGARDAEVEEGEGPAGLASSPPELQPQRLMRARLEDSCSSATIRLSIAQLQLLGDYEPSSSCLNWEADLAKGAIVTQRVKEKSWCCRQYHFNMSVCQGIAGCRSTTVVLELADLMATYLGLDWVYLMLLFAILKPTSGKRESCNFRVQDNVLMD